MHGDWFQKLCEQSGSADSGVTPSSDCSAAAADGIMQLDVNTRHVLTVQIPVPHGPTVKPNEEESETF